MHVFQNSVIIPVLSGAPRSRLMNLFGPDAVNAGADARRTFVGHPGGTKPTIIYHYLQAIEETTRVTKVPTSRASKHCGTTVPGEIFFSLGRIWTGKAPPHPKIHCLQSQALSILCGNKSRSIKVQSVRTCCNFNK